MYIFNLIGCFKVCDVSDYFSSFQGVGYDFIVFFQRVLELGYRGGRMSGRDKD